MCTSDKAVYRGYLQETLSRRFHASRYGDALAIGVGSILFGLAHFGLNLAHFTLFTYPMLAG